MCPREAFPHCHTSPAQNRDTVNTQQDLSEWRTMYHGHGYHHCDYSVTLRFTQTRERTPLQEVQRGLLWRNRYSSGETLSYFKVSDPREMPQEHSNLVTKWQSWHQVTCWAFQKWLSYRRGGDKYYFHVACFANQASKAESYQPKWCILEPLCLKTSWHRLILLDLMLTSTPSTAKSEPVFSAMNHLKCTLRTTLVQNTLSDLMQMRSSDHAMKA